MRKRSAGLLVCALWLALQAKVAVADGMVLPLPETPNPAYLAVRMHHVTVQIEDGLAVTQVEQEFYNPHGFPIVGRYLFPIPPEAVLSGFEVSVDGQGQEVVRQDSAETNATLYSAVNQQGDPSLLQYADWESLAFDLSLAPAESRKMTLEYQELLVPRGGLYRYRYVLSTERYSSEPLEEVSVTVDLKSSAGLASLYVSNHQVTTDTLPDGGTRVHWKAEGANPTHDFELFFAPAGDGFGGGFLTGERQDQDHFLFLFSPELGQGRAPRLPKDIVFAMDRSGSMTGEKIEQVRSALQHILGQLHEEDRFALLAFNDRVSTLSYALQPVSNDTLQKARHFVDALAAEGGTDLEVALQTALEILLGTPERGATRLVVFLSDGLPTSGITDEGQIAAALARTNDAAEARLHVFGVGYDVNTHFLDRLATESNGTVTYVRPGENLQVALTGLYQRVADPVLTDLQLEFQGLDAIALYPPALPDLYQGSSLLLAGRYQALTDLVSVRVRGRSGEVYHEYVYHFRLDELQNHDFVPRLWATRRVGALLDQVRIHGWSQELEDEIRELGLGYGVVTPYTEFIIEDQATGAASADNMALYGSAELNQASGQVTFEARLQNQAYQEAVQAGLAQGANLANYGQHSLAEIGAQQVDLSLLQGRRGPVEPITGEWLEDVLQPDRTVEFGSEEYFVLASDPDVRPYLQSGRQVVFSHNGEVIAIRDHTSESSGLDVRQTDQRADLLDQDTALTRTNAAGQQTSLPRVLRWLALVGVLWVLFCALTAAAGVGYLVRQRSHQGGELAAFNRRQHRSQTGYAPDRGYRTKDPIANRRP